jgi:hypothetical protein
MNGLDSCASPKIEKIAILTLTEKQKAGVNYCSPTCSNPSCFYLFYFFNISIIKNEFINFF